MIKLKACPRCAGDLYRDRDSYGDFEKCLQCGHIIGESTQPEIVDGTGYIQTDDIPKKVKRQRRVEPTGNIQDQKRRDKAFANRYKKEIELRRQHMTATQIVRATGAKYDTIRSLIGRIDNYLAREKVVP